MADVTGTTTTQLGEWDEDYKRFWDEYVDFFWGEGTSTGTSYYEMLKANEDWLRDVYLKNNAALTDLEKSYIREVSGATQDYLKGLEGGTMRVRGPSGPTSQVVPKGVQRTLDAEMSAKLTSALDKYSAGQQQAGRIKEMGEKFTPHAADISYMDALLGLSGQGQELREAEKTTTETGDVDIDEGLSGQDWVRLGTGALGFLATKPSGSDKMIGQSLYDVTLGSDWFSNLTNNFSSVFGFGGGSEQAGNTITDYVTSNWTTQY